jgi:hypothetical protein
MELFILLAYPIVFVHGTLRKYLMSEEGVSAVNFSVHLPAKIGR